MGKKLTKYVSLTDEDGTVHTFGPDDELPDWAEARITNPGAYESDEVSLGAVPGPGQLPDEGGEPVVAGGTGGNSAPNYSRMRKDDLVALAQELGVDVSGTKDEIVARLKG